MLIFRPLSAFSGGWSAVGFTLSLVVPSFAIVDRFLGVSGVVAYGAIASLMLLFVHRQFFERLVPAMTRKGVVGLAGGLVAFLVIAFLVGYPLANSGLLGPGSDRDEHLSLGAAELLHGRYPYYLTGPMGAVISQMPGALILGAPFVLLGNGGYQNLFWLMMFVATVSWFLRDLRPALLLLVVMLSLAPVILREYVTGGDLLANSIYVLLFVMGMVHFIPQDNLGTWKKVLLAVALGVGLSSRAQFVLLLPLVFSALTHRTGPRAATAYVATTCMTFGLVTVPFYLYDPGRFSPLATVGYVQFESLPPFGSTLLVAAFVVASVLCAMDGANSDMSALMRRCTVVLAIPIVSVTLFASFDSGAAEFYYLGYGLSFVVFGAVGFMPRVGGDVNARLPRSTTAAEAPAACEPGCPSGPGRAHS